MPKVPSWHEDHQAKTRPRSAQPLIQDSFRNLRNWQRREGLRSTSIAASLLRMPYPEACLPWRKRLTAFKLPEIRQQYIPPKRSNPSGPLKTRHRTSRAALAHRSRRPKNHPPHPMSRISYIVTAFAAITLAACKPTPCYTPF